MDEKEKKYFELSVLGILASKDAVQKYYNKKLNNQTIEEFFLEQENITKIELNDFKEKYFQDIERIRSTASKERIEGFNGRQEYLKWYLSKYLQDDMKCCYCGVQERDLKTYFHQQNPQYENARQRGRYLEIERIVTAPKEKNIYNLENTDLACYICNNAKSDFISAKKFKPIAKGIYEFWVEIVGIDNIIFPENSNIWDKE